MKGGMRVVHRPIPRPRPATLMLWILITVPAALFVIAMVVLPLVLSIQSQEREQRPSRFERDFRANLRLIQSRPEAVDERLGRAA